MLSLIAAPYYYFQVKSMPVSEWFGRTYLVRFKIGDPKPTPLSLGGLDIARDIQYYDGEGSSDKNQLDVFTPQNDCDSNPVVVFIHGGGWVTGDRRDPFSIHENVCVALARRGITTVNISHTLAPSLSSDVGFLEKEALQHPRQAEDVARAIAWTVDNIDKYGGDPERVYVAGHNSGGHLAALVSTDASYLGAHGNKYKTAVKGMIGVSGMYDIPDFARTSFAAKRLVGPTFGTDLAVWYSASPTWLLSDESTRPSVEFQERTRHTELEPVVPARVLLVVGSEEMGLVSQCNIFGRALEAAGCVDAQRTVVAGSDHFNVLSFVGTERDGITEPIASFVGATRPVPRRLYEAEAVESA